MEKRSQEEREICVFAECRQGEFTDNAFGLVGEGKRLCKKLKGSRLSAFVLGHDMEEVSRALGPYGVPQVFVLEHPPVEACSTERTSNLVSQFIKEKQPFLVLFAADPLGSDLAARVAAKLRAPLVTHCVDIKVGSGGRLDFVKPVSDEMLYATVQASAEGVRIATVSPEVMESEDPDDRQGADVQKIPVCSDGTDDRLKVLHRIKGDPQTISLEEAEIVIAGGRGVGDQESFQCIHDLAEAMEGSVGGSRPVVDEGTLPLERQIGRTGKNTSPRLFVACGISGASEFTGGMEKAKKVVAVNTDRDAPILKMADLGIVGDARQVIPELIRLVKERKDQEKKASEKAEEKKA